MLNIARVRVYHWCSTTSHLATLQADMSDDNQPTRSIDIEGAYNIRDIGGYPTADGRAVRRGALFRSDNLHDLPPHSQRALLSEGIRTVIDLRRTDSVVEDPNVFAESSEVAYHRVNVMGDDPLVDTEDTNVSSLGPDRPPEIYTAILDRRQQWMGEVVKILAAPNALPALYHCNSGRDRAGLVTMLLLGVAGVPRDAIIRDYTLSARYLWRRILDREAGRMLRLSPDAWDASEDGRAAYLQERDLCPPQAMRASIEHVHQVYGGPRAYLLAAGVTEPELHRLRAAVLEGEGESAR